MLDRTTLNGRLSIALAQAILQDMGKPETDENVEKLFKALSK